MEKDIYDKMVKRTILYTFSLWLVLFSLAGVWGFYAYGDFKEIGGKKILLTEKMNELEHIKKSGLEFNDFKRQDMKAIAGDKNMQNIVRVMEKEFYDQHFKNSSEEPYEEFMVKKTKEIEERIAGDEHQSMQRVSSTVLPSYSTMGVDFGEGSDYSELHFVNYVERIMQTFNLDYKGDIGIEDVLPVIDENEEQNRKKGDKVSDDELLANKIFYIPLSFTIEGSKASIIDLIYFSENVGKVNVEKEDLAIHVDNFFKKGEDNHRDNDLVLDGEILSGGYNIYLNQLIDIESVSFDEYIYTKREGDSRGEFISNLRKKPQGLEKFEAEITLRFYVKGISDYKLEKKYEQVIKNLLEFQPDIVKSQNTLSKLKTSEKTPEVALLLKKLVSYSASVGNLGANLNKYKTLSPEEIYNDILRAIELERVLKKDLEKIGTITKVSIEKLEKETEDTIK